MNNGKKARLNEVKDRAVRRTEARIRMNVEKMAEDNERFRTEFDEVQKEREAKDARREEARKQAETKTTETPEETVAPKRRAKKEETPEETKPEEVK